MAQICSIYRRNSAIAAWRINVSSGARNENGIAAAKSKKSGSKRGVNGVGISVNINAAENG